MLIDIHKTKYVAGSHTRTHTFARMHARTHTHTHTHTHSRTQHTHTHTQRHTHTHASANAWAHLPGMMTKEPWGSMATRHTLRMLGVSEAEMPHM